MNTRLLTMILGPVLALGYLAAVQVHAAPVASYRCGGIGQAEQSRFKQDAHRHDALVTFSTPGGAYVADASVRLTNAHGDVVLQGRCDGPLMLLDVPGPGTYRLHATYKDRSQTKTIGVREQTARVAFVWDVS